MSHSSAWLRIASLAIRQCYRERRAPEIRVLFLSMLIAVTITTTIGSISERLTVSMQQRATEFLGADLVVHGNEPSPPESIQMAKKWALDYAQTLEFSTVIATEEHIQLASVKAVSSSYPLRGRLLSTTDPTHTANSYSGGRPAPGEVWAESRLLAALSLTLGDWLEVGQKKLHLTRILTGEPDRPDDLRSLMPRVLMALEDVPATGLIQPGSQLHYRDLWSGSLASLIAYRQSIEPQLRADQRIETLNDDENSRLGRSLERAEQYLSLASLVGILLAAVAVALAASRFANVRLDASALLRCLGLPRHQVLLLYAIQLALIGSFAGFLGAVLGYGVQYGLLHSLHDVLPMELGHIGLKPAFAGMLVGLIILAGFAYAPLHALSQTPPIRILRRDILPKPPQFWLTLLAILGTLFVIIERLGLDGKMIGILAMGLLVMALSFGGILILSLKGLRRLTKQAPVYWRLGLGQLLRHPVMALGQTLAFGLILLTISLVALLRFELLAVWQAQLPDQAANHFAINIQPHEAEAFEQSLQHLVHQTATLYPIVRGRLIAINGQPTKNRALPDSRGDQALRRDLNLTWAESLRAPQTQFLSGTGWDTTTTTQSSQSLPQVSIEAKLAESLNIQRGDQLTFNFGGNQRTAQVTSIRSVNWDKLQPNFYLIFEPNALTGLTMTFMASFHWPTGQDQALVQLSRAFPGTTLIPINDLLARLQEILAQVSLAIECILLLVLAAGTAVLVAGLLTTRSERLRQGAILRTLGAPKKLLKNTLLSEFMLLGIASGLIATLGCELITALLYAKVFSLNGQLHPGLWLALPLTGALLIGGAGMWVTRKAMSASPLSLLRE